VVTDLLVRINATAAGYDAAMAKAQLSTYKFDTALRSANLAVASLEAEMAAAGPAAAASAAKMAEAQTAATLAMTKKVGTAFGVMGLAGAAGFGMVAKAAAEFDEKMATLASLIPHTAKQMDGLRTSAMNAGKDIAVSGTDAAAAEIELAKAGISAADIMGGALRGALLLAAAGQTDVANATEIAASAMTQFGLHGKDVGHIADLLAAGADKSLGSVTDLGYALSQAGTTAHQAGLSIEQTTGVLAEFAAAGLIGEKGGTTFKQMLLQLEAPTDKAKELMDQFGLSLYDAGGNMKSMPAIAGSLQKAFGDLEPAVRNAALATIFGSRAVQGANILMQAGSQVTADWINKVNDQGFAYRQATDKLDSLNGDLDRFKANLSNAAVTTGEFAQGPLRELVQMLDGLVGGFNGLPSPIKASVVALLAGAAVIGTLGFAISRLIIGFISMQATMAEAGMAMGGLTKRTVAMRAGAFAAGLALKTLSDTAFKSHETLSDLSDIAGDVAIGFAVGGPYGAAIGGAVGLLQMMTTQSEYATQAQAGLAEMAKAVAATLDQQTGAVTKSSATYVTQRLAAEGAYTAGRALGISQQLLTAAALGNAPALAKVNDILAAQNETLDHTANGWERADLAGNLLTVKNAVGPVADAIQKAGTNMRVAAGAQGQLTIAADGTIVAFKKEESAAHETAQAIDDLTSKILKQALAAIQSKRDQIALIETYKAAEAEARKGAKTLDLNTQAGRNNFGMLLDLADQIDHTKGFVNESIPAWEKQRREFIAVAEQMGANSDRAKFLADKYLAIPTSVETKMTADASDAIAKALNMRKIFNDALDGIADETVNISLSAQALKVENTLSRFAPHALGGPIRGPGSGTSDSIPAMLSAGEHVWTAAEVTRAGGHAVVEGLRRLAMLGELPRRGDISMFAGGGPVTIDPTVSQSGVSSSVGAVNSMFEHIAAMLGVALSKRLNKMLTQMSFGAGSPLGWAGSLTPAGIARGQQFAQSQVGKPYKWGAVGPGSYDCSGFQSAVLNSAHNAYPYRRLGSTASMPWAGSAPGVGRYTIGWSTNVDGSGIGHTSGNIGGLNVESNGSDGVVTGSSALSPLNSMFYGLMHYDRGGVLRPGLTLAYNGTGADEHVMRFAGGGAVPTIPPSHPDQVTLTDLHKLLRDAFKHFWFGPNATADKTKSEVHDLMQALKDALGKDSPLLAHVKKLGDNLIQAAKAQDRVSDHLDALRDRMDAYAKSVAGTFKHDPFGGGAENLLTQLRADRNDARKMHQALRKAKDKGLDGGLFKALAASGDLETAQQLANMTPAQIHQYEVAWKQRNKAAGSLGQYAGQQVFGQEIKHVRTELHHLNKELHHLRQEIHHLGPRVEHGARKGTHDGARDGMREQGRRAVFGTR
jgi:TP901 family phage tail tape measure protein